jgi:subtilisin family serine protease
MNRALGLLLGTALLATQALSLSAEETARYLVAPRSRGPAAHGRVASQMANVEGRRVRAFHTLDAFAADLTGDEAAALQSGGDLIVEPVVPRHALDLDFESRRLARAEAEGSEETPWGVAAVRAPEVWPVTRGENVNVVVIDTGIDVLHPDLTAYKGGYNVIAPDQLPLDGHTHGTHVAGIIAAGQNGFGVVGVAPKVNLWAVKALDDDGDGSSEMVVAAVEWVLAKAKAEGGRWVVNTSLGAAFVSEVEERAVSDLIAAGIVMVASVGNNGAEEISFPASYPGVIAVGAHTQTTLKANFSNYGPGLAVLAPGTAIQSTIIPGRDVQLALSDSGGIRFPTWDITGAPYKKVTGKVIDCGLGDPADFPRAVRGEIALVRRGKNFFFDIARNAKAAAAAAVIIESFENDQSGAHNWSFYPTPADDPSWENFVFPLAVGVKYSTGEEILQQGGKFTIDYQTIIYGTLNGTSMAAPHVTGTVALLLSLAPNLTPAYVGSILRITARDMYTPGWDPQSGSGAVDALHAAQWVAPEKFGVPPPPPPAQGRRRSVR